MSATAVVRPVIEATYCLPEVPVDVDHLSDGSELYRVGTPLGMVGGLTLAEAEAVVTVAVTHGDYCHASRRLDKDRRESCTRSPGHDGDHVDGRAVILTRLGYADGSRYVPAPATAGPWSLPWVPARLRCGRPVPCQCGAPGARCSGHRDHAGDCCPRWQALSHR